jgi:hypothetical protein
MVRLFAVSANPTIPVEFIPIALRDGDVPDSPASWLSLSTAWAVIIQLRIVAPDKFKFSSLDFSY